MFFLLFGGALSRVFGFLDLFIARGNGKGESETQNCENQLLHCYYPLKILSTFLFIYYSTVILKKFSD